MNLEKKIGIIDSGVWNKKSLLNSLSYIGYKNVDICSSYKKINNYSLLILPGVGAFPHAIHHIKSRGLDNMIREFSAKDRPVLGICLGMQLLANNSGENGTNFGLGLIPGSVKKMNISNGKKVQINWKHIKFNQDNEFNLPASKEKFYFIHSYSFNVDLKKNLVATYQDCEDKIAAIVSNGYSTGLQFHPEKSGKAGLKYLSKVIEKKFNV